MRNVIDYIKAFFQNNRKSFLRGMAFIAYSISLVLIFALIINLNIVAKTNDNIYSLYELEKISSDFDCILILGAGVRKDGSPTPMLNDRLTTGYEAYISEKSDIIFLSGDSERSDYTETVTMKNVLLEKNVDKDCIISDGYGLSTYESIWRAKNVYGFKRILIVSQRYHLHRAIYIAHEMGLEAYGIDAALQGYAKQPFYSMREYLARIKDMIYAEMLPLPTYRIEWETSNE